MSDNLSILEQFLSFWKFTHALLISTFRALYALDVFARFPWLCVYSLATYDALITLALKAKLTGRVRSIYILELLAHLPYLLLYCEAHIVFAYHAPVTFRVELIPYLPARFASSCKSAESLAFLVQVTEHWLSAVFSLGAGLLSSENLSRCRFVEDGCDEHKFCKAFHFDFSDYWVEKNVFAFKPNAMKN